MRILFLNGFDRSGSSMIGGLLSKHPDIAYFFQPFNRTEVHATQYQIWKPEDRHKSTESFLSGLLEGRVERDYLGADLFDTHSTAKRPDASRLNVIKETKLHFKTSWLRSRFPQIEVHGIWREPRGILCSLLRNGFASDWYGDVAFDAIRATITKTPALACYEPILRFELEDYEKVALVIAARTHIFSQSIRADQWVIYEEVLADCDAVLNKLTRHFDLAPFAFSEHLAQDFNVVGKPSEGAELWRSYFNEDQSRRLDAIFGELEAVGPRTRRDERATF